MTAILTITLLFGIAATLFFCVTDEVRQRVRDHYDEATSNEAELGR